MPLKKEYVTDLRRGGQASQGPKGRQQLGREEWEGGAESLPCRLHESRAQGRRSGWAGLSVSADFGAQLRVPQCFGTWIRADVGQGMPVGGVK